MEVCKIYYSNVQKGWIIQFGDKPKNNSTQRIFKSCEEAENYAKLSGIIINSVTRHPHNY